MDQEIKVSVSKKDNRSSFKRWKEGRKKEYSMWPRIYIKV